MSRDKKLTADDLESLQKAAEILGVPIPSLPATLNALRSQALVSDLARQDTTTSAQLSGFSRDQPIQDNGASTASCVVPDENWWHGTEQEPTQEEPGQSSEALFSSTITQPLTIDNDPFDLSLVQIDATDSAPISTTATANPSYTNQPPWALPFNAHDLNHPPYLPSSDNGLVAPLDFGVADGSDLGSGSLPFTFPMDFLCDNLFMMPAAENSASSFRQDRTSLDTFVSIDPGMLSGSADIANNHTQFNTLADHRTEGQNRQEQQRVPSDTLTIIPRHQVQKQIRRKRRPYDEAHRQQTSMTRQMRGCIRCRMNRKRCIPDPTNLQGPCLTCQGTIFNTFRLPCLRYKIVDSSLYRTVGNDSTEALHPLTGPRFGDFHQQKIWISSETRIFDLSQGRGSVLHITVRQFEPPQAEMGLTDNKGANGVGREFYCIPWAIADLGKTINDTYDFVDKSVPNYIDDIIGHGDPLQREVFDEAKRVAYSGEPNLLVRDALRFWTAARFIEGGWRCCGEDKLGAEKISPPWRPKDRVALPPYIDYQFGSILMEKILGPLSRKLLESLEEAVMKNQPSNWFYIFLVNFILLHSFELIMKHEVDFTKRRNYPVRYFDMKLIRAYQSAAKTLLAHFHYINKGNIPFQSTFDWTASSHRRMAQLEPEQLLFIRRLTQQWGM